MRPLCQILSHKLKALMFFKRQARGESLGGVEIELPKALAEGKLRTYWEGETESQCPILVAAPLQNAESYSRRCHLLKRFSVEVLVPSVVRDKWELPHYLLSNIYWLDPALGFLVCLVPDVILPDKLSPPWKGQNWQFWDTHAKTHSS